MIQLFCRNASGQIVFAKALIEGHHAPERAYDIVDHTVQLVGYPGPVLHHDADYMLSIPGGVYRLPTPAEQNAQADAQRKAATVEEAVPPAENDTPSPDAGSAASKRARSANGG